MFEAAAELVGRLRRPVIELAIMFITGLRMYYFAPFVVSNLLDVAVTRMASRMASQIVEEVRILVRVKILNIQNEKTYTSLADHLRMGDELCRGRITPMSYQQIRIVDNIYQICRSKAGDIRGDTPLMEASRLGLTDILWGFIECAKQTHKKDRFSWINDFDYQTALSAALDNNHVEVAKLLLNYVSSPRDLTSEWFRNRKTLRPLLRDPKYDAFIFDMLEDAERIDWEPQTLNDDKHQERRIYLNELDHGLLQLNNTILHLVSKFGDVDHVNAILQEQPSLIYSRNSEGETPVYVAAREGHADVLRLIINKFKENNDPMEPLFIRLKDKHNALHIAIQNHHVEVVFRLIKEVPQLANHINDFSESPLYLAAERRYYTIVERILMKCGEKLFTGPKGKTALHAAAISNSAGSKKKGKEIAVEKAAIVEEKSIDVEQDDDFVDVERNNSAG